MLDELVSDVRDLFVRQVDQAGAGAEQTTAEADVHRRLHFVARQHPDFDAALLQQTDRLGHLVLEFVLNAGRAQQRQVALDQLRAGGNVFFAALK